MLGGLQSELSVIMPMRVTKVKKDFRGGTKTYRDDEVNEFEVGWP